MFKSIRHHMVLFFAALFLIQFIAPLSFSVEQKKIDKVRKYIEKLEAGKEKNKSIEELLKRIEEDKALLEKHIEESQADIEAVILYTRISMIEGRLTPIVLTKDNMYDDFKDSYAPQHSKLDRAIALQPDNARAHYWKARLYGVIVSTSGASGRLEKRSIDINKAISFAKRAVRLDPQTVVFREALALYLVATERFKEALKVIDTEATKKNLIYLLLKDINEFPIPDGALYSWPDSKRFGEMKLERRRFRNYPMLRVFIYVVPMSASEIEAFYQSKWTGFKFFDDDFIQRFKYDKNTLMPASSKSEVDKYFKSKKKKGITLVLIQEDNSAENKKQETVTGNPLPPTIGDVYCLLFYVNYRNAK